MREQLSWLSTDETAWPLLICVLGPFRLLKAGQPIEMRGASKGASLLATLALAYSRHVARETLLDTLWPDSEADLAAQALHSLVRDLHKRLRSDLGGVRLIVHEDGHYRLNGEAGVGVDVMVFDALADAGHQKVRAGNPAAACAFFERAIRLYRGDLGVGMDVKATVERERLHGQYLTLLMALAEYRYSQADYAASLACAQRLLAHDACREDADRLAMRCYVRCGERAQALRQYQVCVRALRAEFDAPPEPATVALYDQVRLDPRRI